MKIPITMCHGINDKWPEGKPLLADRFDRLMKIVYDMGFQTIQYDQLDSWRKGQGTLPSKPIMIDFDHPVKSMRYEIRETLERYGFKPTLFINTGMIEKPYRGPWPEDKYPCMTWDEVGELIAADWHIGAHTVSHPDLSQLSLEDPTGEKVRAELIECNETLKKRLGITPKDFAYTATTWSSAAEREVMKLYRFGRLWIIGSEYQVDGRARRYADLVNVPGPDESDGGPPKVARYITKETHPYRLPSMEIQGMIYDDRPFREYLEGALADTA